MNARFIRVIACLVAPLGCSSELSIPSGAQLVCTSDSECPGGLLCEPVVQRCVETLDVTPPTVVGAVATSETTVDITLSEVISPAGITDTAKYSLSPSIAVDTAVLQLGGNVITLFTGFQIPEQVYDVTVDSTTDVFGNTSGPETISFSGFGSLADTTPPTLLSPADQARLSTATALLLWSPSSGNEEYIVEIATDGGFTQQVAGSPFTVVAPTTTLDAALPVGRTYYWRVRGAATTFSASRAFGLLGSEVYVYCADGEDCRDPSPSAGLRLGTQDDPFVTIGRGVRSARDLGATAVWVASRGVSAYQESISLIGTGLDLLGGYVATFVSRDPVGNKVRVQSVDATLTIIDATSATTVSGFALEPDSDGIVISSPTASIRIEDVSVDVQLAGAHTIAAVDQSDVLFQRVQLASFATDEVIGLDYKGGNGTLNDVLIDIEQSLAATGNDVIGIQWGAADSLFVSNSNVDLQGGANTDRLCGLCVSNIFDGVGTLSVANTRLSTGDANNESRALEAECLSCQSLDVEVRDSMLLTGDAPTTLLNPGRAAGSFDVVGDVILENNLAQGLIDLQVEDEATSIRLVNNIIATPTDVFTVRISGTSTVRPPTLLAHNMIILDGLNTDASGLRVASVNPILVNNVFLSIPAMMSGMGTSECLDTGSTTRPKTLFNNAFVGCATRLWADPSSYQANPTDVNNQDGTEMEDSVCTSGVDCPNLQSAGNYAPAIAPADAFTDFDGADNDPWTLEDNDYSLMGLGVAAFQALGVSTFSTSCGTTNPVSGESCGDVGTDLSGASRPATPAVGPLEP